MLDKKLLRKYADPGLTIPAGHGLLRAEQVKYIIRTAVKIIGHHRLLILYIYDREQALQGSCSPRWTMFQQGKSDYITLEQAADGRSKWRTACLENLEPDNRCYYFSNKYDVKGHPLYREYAREPAEAQFHWNYALFAEADKILRQLPGMQTGRPARRTVSLRDPGFPDLF